MPPPNDPDNPQPPMNEEKIPGIIRASRPEGQDDSDPDIAAALESMRGDPAKAQALEEEREFDRTFSAKLNEAITPPEDLKQRILANAAGTIAGAALESSPDPLPEGKVIHTPWWRSPAAMSAAAAFILLLGLAAFFTKAPQAEASDVPELSAFYDMAADRVSGGISGIHRESRLENIRQYLDEHGSPSPQALPGRFAAMEGKGCLAIKWRQQPVSLICIGDGSTYHLFIIQRSSIPNCSPPDSPEYEQRQNLVLVKWSDPEHVYVLVGKGEMKQVRQLL